METLAPEHQRLTTDEARALTNEIRADMDGVHVKVLRAHRGQVWTALAYGSFREWASREFDKGERRIYQLLNYGRVEEAICTNGAKTDLNERQARELEGLEPEQARAALAAADEAAAATKTKRRTTAHVAEAVAKVTGNPVTPKRTAPAVEPAPVCPICGEYIDKEQPTEKTSQGVAHANCCEKLTNDDEGDPVWLEADHWEHANAQQRQTIMLGHFQDWDDACRGSFLDSIITNYRLLFIAAIARAK